VRPAAQLRRQRSARPPTGASQGHEIQREIWGRKAVLIQLFCVAINNNLTARIHAFEQWCYRRLLKVKWTDKVSNEEILNQIKEDKMYLYKSIQKLKLAFAGHVLHGSSG